MTWHLVFGAGGLLGVLCGWVLGYAHRALIGWGRELVRRRA